MAAKLEWNTGYLWLGQLPLAQARHTRKWGWQWTLIGHRWTGGHMRAPRYEVEADCRQDCESEVRRLLKEAGVELA